MVYSFGYLQRHCIHANQFYDCILNLQSRNWQLNDRLEYNEQPIQKQILLLKHANHVYKMAYDIIEKKYYSMPKIIGVKNRTIKVAKY